jgi:DNA polymerase III sliding clamp (beta) subunit (PCNA family)
MTTVTVSVSALQEALALCKKIDNRKSAFPLLRSVLLSGVDAPARLDCLRIRATDITSHLTVDVPALGSQHAEPFGILVDLATLAKLLGVGKRVKGATATLEISAAGLRVTVGSALPFSIPAAGNPSDFPALPPPGRNGAPKTAVWGQQYTDAQAFATTLEWVALAMSTDVSRQMLAAVRFSPDRTIVACDGNRLHIARSVGAVSTAVAAESLVPASVIPVLVAFAKMRNLARGGLGFTATFGATSAAFEAPYATLTTCLVESVFPPFEEAIPKESPHRFDGHPAALDDVVSMARTGGSRRLTLHAEDEGLNASAVDEEGHQIIKAPLALEKVRVDSTQASPVSFNPRYVQEALALPTKLRDSARMSLEFGGAESPLHISYPDDDREAVIMGIRI